jgi:SAM-dependent methyltransferase
MRNKLAAMMPKSMADVVAYWDRSPCNVRHGTDPAGTPEWSRQVTWRKYFVEPHIRGFAQFERWRGKEVLEIGCGIGTDTLEFAKAGARVCAIDASLNSTELARTRMPKWGQAFIFWINVDAEQWLPSGPFDLVYSFGVLHHAPHPERILQLARKRITADGELRIMLYAKYSLKHLLGTQPEAQAGCPLVKWYSAREARNLLRSYGFEVTSIEKTHIFPWKVSEYVKHHYVKAWPWNWIPQWLFRRLECILGHHLLIVAKPSTR